MADSFLGGKAGTKSELALAFKCPSEAVTITMSDWYVWPFVTTLTLPIPESHWIDVTGEFKIMRLERAIGCPFVFF